MHLVRFLRPTPKGSYFHGRELVQVAVGCLSIAFTANRRFVSLFICLLQRLAKQMDVLVSADTSLSDVVSTHWLGPGGLYLDSWIISLKTFGKLYSGRNFHILSSIRYFIIQSMDKYVMSELKELIIGHKHGYCLTLQRLLPKISNLEIFKTGSVPWIHCLLHVGPVLQ